MKTIILTTLILIGASVFAGQSETSQNMLKALLASKISVSKNSCAHVAPELKNPSIQDVVNFWITQGTKEVPASMTTEQKNGHDCIYYETTNPKEANDDGSGIYFAQALCYDVDAKGAPLVGTLQLICY